MDADGQRCIAHVGIVDRVLRVGNDDIHVAGIQNMAVDTTLRGQRLCRGAMEAVQEEARRRGYDCGFLFCTSDIGAVYERLGWTLLPGREIIRIDDGVEKLIPGKNVAMFLPLDRDDFPEGDIHLMGNDW